MLISNSKGFIFFHAPKSGGTSITELLDREIKWDDIILGGTPTGEIFQETWGRRFNLGKHSLPIEIKRVIGEKKYLEFKKFVVVRNPLNRLISAFKFLKNSKKTNPDWFKNSSDCSYIEDWSGLDKFVDSEYFKNIFKKPFDNCTDVERFFLPQSFYFDVEEMAKGRFKYFKIEDLGNSLDSLIKCGFLIDNCVMPHSNKTDWIGEESLDITEDFCREIYKEDYKNFHY